MSTWGRSNPDDAPTDAPETSTIEFERVKGRTFSRRLTVVGITLAITVATLWLKPWDSTNPATPPPVAITAPVALATKAPTPVPSVATPIPTATAAATLDPLTVASRRRQCQSPTEWRLVTAESTVTRRTRTMYATSPMQASGPNDSSLPLSYLYADTLRAVGVCVPRTPESNPTALLGEVVLWQVESDGVAREIDRPTLIDPALYDVGEAYFAPSGTADATWPPGRYVFEIRAPAGGAGSRWMALQFVTTRSS